MTAWIDTAREALAGAMPTAVTLRRELHAHPDLSGKEGPTTDRIRSALGFQEEQRAAGTGLLVRVGPSRGPAIAVRAELDALPGVETTGLPWSGADGRMHACGHDVHLAALTALCHALQRSTVPPPVALLAVFQPREESIPSGASDIVSSAQWAPHDVRAVIGAHVQPLLPAATVAATPGAVNAAVCNIEITVSGSGGHAAYPHTTEDPVLALSEIIVSLQQVVSRRIDPMHSAVLSIGVLRAGTAPGIIPTEASAVGTLRALDPADLDTLQTTSREIVHHLAQAHRCEGTVSFDRGEPVLVNEERLARAVRPILNRRGVSIASDLRSCGADDFAYYAQRHPSLMMFVGVGAGGQLNGPGLHHPAFYPPDAAISDVADTLLAGFLAAHELLNTD